MPATDDPLSPRYAEPAQAPDRSSQRALARAVSSPPRLSARRPASRSSRRPGCAGSTSSARGRPTRPGWRSASTSTRSTTRTSSRATSARRSTSTTTTCSSCCTSRATTRRSARLNAAELDIFVGPDYLITLPERAAAAVSLPVRALPGERGAAREPVLQGRRLPALQDRRRRASTPRSRCCARWATSSSASSRTSSRASGRGRARHLQRQAGDHQLPQDRPPAARRLPRPRAHQGALHPRRPRHLLRRHQRRVRAHLGHARELQGGRRGARGDQRVGDLAPLQRDLPGPHRVQRDPPAADADRVDLGHERPRPRRGRHDGLLRRARLHGRHPRRR